MSSFAESDMMGFFMERGRLVPAYEIHIKPLYILYGKAECRELLYAFGVGVCIPLGVLWRAAVDRPHI